MKLAEQKHISVLNYNDNYICAYVAPNRSIRFEPSVDGRPSLTPLTLEEIKYINNNNAFRNGILEFSEEIEDEVYEELRIDKDNVMKNSEIREILLNPTKIGLQKIVSLTSLSDFDRIRCQFQKLKAEGYRLTLDIANIVTTRTKELLNGKVKTNIIIDDADLPQNNKKVAELEQQLKEQGELLKKLTEQLALSNKTTTETSVESKSVAKESEPTETEQKTVKKSPGRPRK